MSLLFKNFTLLDLNEKKELLALRNRQNIREMMINSDEILLEDHLAFIDDLMANRDKRYFAIFFNNLLIGSASLVKDKTANWGVYFADSSSPIIKAVAGYLFIDFVINDPIYAFVKKGNSNALNFNRSLGFELIEEGVDLYKLLLTKARWQDKKSSKLSRSIAKQLESIESKFKE